MKPGQNGSGGRPSTSAHAVWDALEWDGRVAWRAAGPDRYLYRPGQMLVDATYAARLAPYLGKAGARPVGLRSREGRLLLKLGVQRWSLRGDGREAPEAVDALRERLDDVSSEEQSKAVALNHVIAGAQVLKFGPGDLPRAGGRAPVEAEPSKSGGTGKGVRIAILDTGFVPTSTARHPLLASGYVDDGNDRDALYDEASKEILSIFGGHGTFIAGIIRQQAPDTELDPEVTLDDLGLADDAEVAQDLLRARPAHIVNLSLAGPTKGGTPPPALAKALDYLRDESETVFVAAAGNDYELAEASGRPHQRMWPAAFGELEGYGHVVGVAAVDRRRVPAVFSNRGPWVRACAYGVEERSTYIEGHLASPAGVPPFPDATAVWSGTSFAAPRVAGVIAATMSADPELSARDALEAVLDAAPPGPPDLGRFVG